jgi:hypothetical protein
MAVASPATITTTARGRPFLATSSHFGRSQHRRQIPLQFDFERALLRVRVMALMRPKRLRGFRARVSGCSRARADAVTFPKLHVARRRRSYATARRRALALTSQGTCPPRGGVVPPDWSASRVSGRDAALGRGEENRPPILRRESNGQAISPSPEKRVQGHTGDWLPATGYCPPGFRGPTFSSGTY